MYLCEDCRKQLYAYKYNNMLQHYVICDHCNKATICCDVEPLTKKEIREMPIVENDTEE